MKKSAGPYFLLLVIFIGCAGDFAGAAPLKLTVAWNVPLTEAGVRTAVAGAKELGFNGLAWSPKGLDESVVARCREAGLRCYKVLEPLEKRPGARLQVIERPERLLPGFAGTLPAEYQYSGKPLPEQSELLRTLPAEYQYGGEPLPGHPEVLNEELTCPLDSGIVASAVREVARARRLGYDGVCWDYVGYRNYHSCECETCRAALKAFLKNSPDRDPRRAKAAFYTQVLTELYARLYDAAHQAAPDFTVLTHSYPAFLPDPFYSQQAKVDYCSITASWFFQPHWPIEKVREYAGRTVRGPYHFSWTGGMPMIGCFTSGDMARHRKSGERLRSEFQALRDAGARAVMVCELGDILADGEVRQAVRLGLTGIH